MWRKRSGALEAGCALQRDEGVGAESGSGNTSAASKRGSISGIGFMDPLYCNSGNIDQDYCDPCTEYFHSFLSPLSTKHFPRIRLASKPGNTEASMRRSLFSSAFAWNTQPNQIPYHQTCSAYRNTSQQDHRSLISP